MTNMPASATTDVDLDLLVPPPGPRWRRAVGWLAFVAALVGIGWLWTSGTATPRLEGEGGWSSGGEGPVHSAFSITNRSRVAVELVDGPEARDGLRTLGYQVSPIVEGEAPGTAPLEADPFPARIEPGEAILLTIWFEVTDCDAVAADTGAGEQIDLQVRIADGPFSGVTRTRRLDAPVSLAGEQGLDAAESWTVAMTEFACP